MGEAMQVEQARAAQHLFDLGPPVPFAKHAHQLDLPIGARREVGVAGFGRHRRQPAVDAMQIGLAEAGAGGNHRRVAVVARRPVLQRAAFVRREDVHAVGHRLEIVEQRARRVPSRAAISSAAMSQATFVSLARLPTTGPATPNGDRLDCERLPDVARERIEDVGEAVRTSRGVTVDGVPHWSRLVGARRARAAFSFRRRRPPAALWISVDYSVRAWPLPVPPPSRVVSCSSATSICGTTTCATCRSGD